MIPLDDLRGGIEIGQRLVAECLVASGLLLVTHSHFFQCQDLETLAGKAPYYLLYTAEGLPEDVDTELEQVRKHLQKFGQSVCVDFKSISASELWAGWMRSAHDDSTAVRMGLPPKDLAQVADLFSDRVNFLVDLPSGISWYAKEQNSDWEIFSNLRKRAQELGGYLVVLPGSSTPLSANEICGNHPESIDLMERFTSDITGHLTINTDFAETEVDERQTNLTRFPLFFPEKRQFFLETIHPQTRRSDLGHSRLARGGRKCRIGNCRQRQGL